MSEKPNPKFGSMPEDPEVWFMKSANAPSGRYTWHAKKLSPGQLKRLIRKPIDEYEKNVIGKLKQSKITEAEANEKNDALTREILINGFEELTGEQLDKIWEDDNDVHRADWKELAEQLYIFLLVSGSRDGTLRLQLRFKLASQIGSDDTETSGKHT